MTEAQQQPFVLPQNSEQLDKHGFLEKMDCPVRMSLYYARQRTVHFFWCAPVISRITWQLWKWRSLVLYKLTGNCGNACGWVEPYGWVPQAECPVHDR